MCTNVEQESPAANVTELVLRLNPTQLSVLHWLKTSCRKMLVFCYALIPLFTSSQVRHFAKSRQATDMTYAWLLHLPSFSM